MSDSKSADPSMDEILASIRRIVTEEATSESAAAPSDGAHVSADRDVLVLTDNVPAPPEMKPQPISNEQPLVSGPAHAATASAFDKLAAVRDEVLVERQGPLLAVPGRTLEDITQDLLRPMIKDWLDTNLPAIVQERVDDEIDRIARSRTRPV